MIGNKSPFFIKAIQNNPKGYQYNFCLQCLIGSNKFDFKPLKIIANKKSLGPKPKKKKKCFAFIKSVDSMGLMNIQFSHQMNTNLTISKLNTTFIDIFVTPRSESSITTERDVNLTWNATSFQNETLLVQLNFSSPLSISSSMVYDTINFHVINFTDVFMSTDGLVLTESSKNITKMLRKQMYNTKGTKQFINSAKSTKSLL